MFTDLFNCPYCHKPFDFNEGDPYVPIFHPIFKIIRCRTCVADQASEPLRGLMDFLNQPAFEKMVTGYEYTLPINDPVCYGCQKKISVFEGSSAFSTACGHYLCQSCNYYCRTGYANNTCKNCNIEKSEVYLPADSVIARFSSLIKLGRIKEFSGTVESLAKFDAIEAKKEEDRKSGALKECKDCGIEQPVERLLKCQDCKMVLCGICSFASHREHSVEKLLGIALGEMEQQNGKRYTETLQGLHGNLKYIQTTIDEAVEKVLTAGNDCLANISKRSKYNDAVAIVLNMNKAAVKFEQHCEVYIPVARELATRLTELGEEIAKQKE